jgi:opacity protein-like surface antigen
MRLFHAVSAITLIAMAQTAGSAHADPAMQTGAETPFGGFYIGAEIAHSLANNELGVGGGGSLTFDGWGASGLSGGMFVGYDHLLDNGFLIGGQIGGSISNIGSQVSYSDPFGDEYFRGQLKTDWFATATARAGYLVNPETLLFGSLGITVAHGVGSYSYSNGLMTESDSDREYFYGVALGTIGVETVLSGNLRGRFEYIASYLNTQSFDFDGLMLDVTPIIGSAKVSLVYGFGDPTPTDRDFSNAPETWTGFFGGLKAGHDMGNTELTVTDGGPDGLFVFDGFGSNGLMAGGFVGYDQQIGSRFVVGIEAGASVTTIKNELSLDIGGLGVGSIATGTQSSVNARVRAGVLINPATLIYGYGGYARNRMYTELSNGVDSEREYFSVNAVEFGGGVETFVSEKVSVRGEYGLIHTENLLADIDDFGSLKKLGATGSISAVLHF